MAGHSWIEYRSDDGSVVTFGTFGNNPEGLGNGLHQNRELGWDSDASRTVYINAEQEQRLFEKIAEYLQLGQEAWSTFWPCSGFAFDAWKVATGEVLSHRRFWMISNPAALVRSIRAMAGGA